MKYFCIFILTNLIGSQFLYGPPQDYQFPQMMLQNYPQQPPQNQNFQRNQRNRRNPRYLNGNFERQTENNTQQQMSQMMQYIQQRQPLQIQPQQNMQQQQQQNQENYNQAQQELFDYIRNPQQQQTQQESQQRQFIQNQGRIQMNPYFFNGLNQQILEQNLENQQQQNLSQQVQNQQQIQNSQQNMQQTQQPQQVQQQPQQQSQQQNSPIILQPTLNFNVNPQLKQRLEQDAANLAFEKFNIYRQSQNLYPIQWDPDLLQGCNQHLLYQIQQGVLSHDGFQQRLGKYRNANENVAMVSSLTDLNPEQIAEQFLQKWINSPTHQANLVSTNVKQGIICISWTKEPKYNNVYWATQHNVSYF